MLSEGRKVASEEYTFQGGKVKRLQLTAEDEKALSKKRGCYSTIFFEDIETESIRKELIQNMGRELTFYLERFHIQPQDACLVIGLGNRMSTPDALGPKTLEAITVTNHFFSLDLAMKEDYRPLSVIAPGVMAQTGIETQEYLLALIHQVKPAFIIAIDALASNSLERVMKTIQLTDTGIHPGSGIGNHRKEISKETIGIPVLAIGVPTVVDAATIVQNTLDFLIKKISYQKEKGHLNKTKFLTGYEDVYKNQEDLLTKDEKQNLLGEVGNLTEEEQTALFEEVLMPLGYNLMVTPTEVDALIDHLAKVIATSLNQTLHKK